MPLAKSDRFPSLTLFGDVCGSSNLQTGLGDFERLPFSPAIKHTHCIPHIHLHTTHFSKRCIFIVCGISFFLASYRRLIYLPECYLLD